MKSNTYVCIRCIQLLASLSTETLTPKGTASFGDSPKEAVPLGDAAWLAKGVGGRYHLLMAENVNPAALTPVMQQFMDLKRQHPDSILFFRLGDFYEMFFEDALAAAPVLEVQLTSRDRNSPNPIPMCGIPYHAGSNYLQKLIQKGFKVAICEQSEEPVAGKPGKTIIRREVVRVVTPALVGDPELVPEDARNLLLAIAEKDGRFELGVLDLLKGELQMGIVETPAQLFDWVTRLSPKELLLPEAAKESAWLDAIRGDFPQLVITYRDAYFSEGPLAATRAYLQETQKTSGEIYLSEPRPLQQAATLALDATALSSLEILRSNSAQGDGPCLLGIVDQCSTPMGRRTLKDWLGRPLGELPGIFARHDAVENFIRDLALLEAVRGELQQIRDLERLTSKTALGLSMPRDLVGVREILKAIPRVREILSRATAPLLRQFAAGLDPLPKLTEHLERALEDEAPATLRDGGIFRETYRPEIAELRSLSRDAKGTIAAMETREREATGITSLKIKFSRVFGYTIEITAAHLKKVPSHYTRKQTIANGERFVTEELKLFEDKVLTSEERLRALEENLFWEIRREVASQSGALMANAGFLGQLDCLISFARVSRERGYCRPEMHEGWELEITEGRHPVVETRVPAGKFVPNGISFGQDSARTWIITGPNMAGKSTIMRQVALIALLAHAGCFVPATAAKIPLLDAIFTRIGASDDLARGRSTFMVEMSEVARVLENATPRSLLIIDEIGRGTSTYDGLSLAWSLVEYIHENVGAKTLFATHFHEITALEKSLPQLRNANVLVEKWNNEIVFLHRLAPGVCNRSYGIEVARLAGLPPKVLSRAKDILGVLESQSQRGSQTRGTALGVGSNQMTFFEGIDRPETRARLES